MMLSKKKININSILVTNIIFAFFPLSFILGNLITNINLILFCGLGIFHLKSKILTNKFNLPLKIIFLLFLIILFSTGLSFMKSIYFNEYQNFDRLIKSVFFLRFFLMILIVYQLSELNIINFKYFFISASFFPIFISIDIIFQYIFGFNIIGIESQFYHNSSFFGNELIAGGFIQNFSFFSILFLSFILKKNNYFYFPLVTIGICLLGSGIMLSGNKMPLIMFLFGLFLFFIFTKKLKKIIFTGLVSLIIIIGILIPLDSKYSINYKSFYFSLQQIINQTIEKNISRYGGKKIKVEEEKGKFSTQPPLITFVYVHKDGYEDLFFTAIETWKLHKVFGNGMKSFREDCKKILLEKKRVLKWNPACSNHPHNYYFEILTDLGIFGFIFVLIIASIFIIFLVRNYKFLNNNNIENLFLLATIFSFILEVFPIKSSGSIFTTSNATYIMIMASIILSHKKILKGENFGKKI